MIGILNAYHFDPTPGNYQERYVPLILDFVKKAFPGQTVQNYEIAFGKWPQSINECTTWFITGSPKSAYDSDSWILKLKDFIVELDQQKKKTVGICFGHQIISEALGGKVEKNTKGWGVGVRSFEITQEKPWMQPLQKKISLIFSHQDQVVKIPPKAELLAQDPFCPNQMLQIGQHILTLQGHPEFSVEFAKERLNSRRELMPADTYTLANTSFTQSKDDAVMLKWIQQFTSTTTQI